MPEPTPAPPPADSLSTGALVRRLLGLAWQFRLDCILSLGLGALLLILGLAGLQFLGAGIDAIRHALDPALAPPEYPLGWRPPADWPPLAIVGALAGAIVAFAALRAVLTYAYNMATARLTQEKIVPDLRDRVYARLQRLSFRFYDANASGSILNRVTGDVQNTRLFVDGVILQGILMALTLLVYLGYMLRIHAGLTVACLATTPLIWWVSETQSRRLRPAYRTNRDLYDGLIQGFSEDIRGVRTIKGFAAEAQRIGRFDAANDGVSRQQRRIFRTLSVFTPLTSLLSQANLVVLLAYGGWLHSQDRIALGTGLVVFAGLLQQFSGQVASISTIANSVEQSLTSARRVFEVLDAPLEVRSAPGARSPGRLGGSLAFEGVTFGYRPDAPVLRDLSFGALPGQTVGIFGPTGSGKSTLLSLIPRFYDPQAGRVLADGADLRELDLDGYRRGIGLVAQESFLFSNTVAANIAFGHPRAGREEVERAARLASADGFIRELPAGYDTVLGEGGTDLSGGQRQRLALARALLLEPPILILDDPTASVDPTTEREIAEALRAAAAGRTTFLVSSRLSLLAGSDIILVLDRGRLVDRGTHAELLARPGIYRDTAMLQLMDLPPGGSF